jgi:hypothetical protein
VLRLAQSTLLRSTYTLLAIRDGIESDRRPVLVCPLPSGALPRATATAYTRPLSLGSQSDRRHDVRDGWLLRVRGSDPQHADGVPSPKCVLLLIIACSLVTLAGHSCLSFVLRL